MNIEIKKKRSSLERISAIIVYFIYIGYIFENHSQRTVNLSKILIYLQHFNIIFFIFNKILAFIKYYFIKIFIKILIFIINFIFKVIKFFNIFKYLFIIFNFLNKYLNIIVLFRKLSKKFFKLKIGDIKIGSRLYLFFRVILFLIYIFIRSLKDTSTLFQWFFIKFLVKRQWITGETTLFYISHFVLHHYFLQFLIDLIFLTIEVTYCILQKKRFSRGIHTYFFMYLAFTHITIHLFCLFFALFGKYIKNLYLFSEAVTLNLGNSPDKEDNSAPKIPNEYFIYEENLIDPNPNLK